MLEMKNNEAVKECRDGLRNSSPGFRWDDGKLLIQMRHRRISLQPLDFSFRLNEGGFDTVSKFECLERYS